VTLEKTGDIRVEVAGSKWGRDIKTVDRGLWETLISQGRDQPGLSLLLEENEYSQVLFRAAATTQPSVASVPAGLR
jgi:hypothetical protein